MAKDKLSKEERALQLKKNDEKFCQLYAETGNATMSYKNSYPNVTYSSAKVLSGRKLQKPTIGLRVAEIKEEFAMSVRQTKEKTILDLLQTAELAKADNKFNDYAKLRDMVIKMCGFYEPIKTDVTSGGEKITIKLNLGLDTEE